MQVIISAGAYSSSLLMAFGTGLLAGACLVTVIATRHKRKTKK